ncbi:MAG TPA: MgtC/SapB family protein [Promineifilum sp.]|nr:MgtC/SapB family protein [Promineifilum sp.]HRQ13996.1 MgtC/SapB family protein [Promineifilum sp.]
MDVQTELVLVGRLVLAAFLGAVIGYERELRGRSAGLRTFAAVALGACLFSIISYVVTPDGNETTRIAAQIVTGVGFLGAGVILHGQGHVSGLTTSATLWAAAAVGMAVGFGLYILAVAATLLLVLLLLLRLVPWLDHRAERETQSKE